MYVAVAIDARDHKGSDSGMGPGAVLRMETELETDEGFAPARENKCNDSPSVSNSRVDTTMVHLCSSYLFISKRLTACHLQALAHMLGLPTTGSIDQLRLCIEAVMQEDQDYQNVVVTV